MRLHGKLVGEIEPSDLSALLENQVGESRELDYKLELPGSALADKKEFLADASALANTAGGVLVYGIAESKDDKGQNTGLPDKIVGVPSLRFAIEESRFISMLNDGLSPSIGGSAKVQEVENPMGGDPVLVLGIPRGFAGPYMVTLDKINRFYRRSETGKYLPGVHELRSMFNEQESWTDAVEKFRTDRIELVRERMHSITVERDSSFFMHVLPLGRLREFKDLRPHESTFYVGPQPPQHDGYRHRWNTDGFLKWSVGRDGIATSYIQWFRFGGVEGYCANYVWQAEQNRFINMKAIVDDLYFFISEALKVITNELKLDPPFAIVASLLGARGSMVYHESRSGSMYAIDQDRILLPPVIAESSSQIGLSETLRPLSDALWQCAGFKETPRR
jgi:hypothetical protein